MITRIAGGALALGGVAVWLLAGQTAAGIGMLVVGCVLAPGSTD